MGGGGGTLLHKPNRYVPSQKVVFLYRFGLESGMVTRVNSKWILRNLFI